MNDNPLTKDADREARVRECAYQLWEAEGRPHGRDVEFWVRARELVASDEAPTSDRFRDPVAAPPEPAIEGQEAPPPPQMEEPAADGGDRPQTPRPRRKRRA